MQVHETRTRRKLNCYICIDIDFNLRISLPPSNPSLLFLIKLSSLSANSQRCKYHILDGIIFIDLINSKYGHAKMDIDTTSYSKLFDPCLNCLRLRNSDFSSCPKLFSHQNSSTLAYNQTFSPIKIFSQEIYSE